MSDKDLIREYKQTISDLTKDKRELTDTIEDKDSRIKKILIQLEQANQDVQSAGKKIAELEKTVLDEHNEPGTASADKEGEQQNQVERTDATGQAGAAQPAVELVRLFEHLPGPGVATAMAATFSEPAPRPIQSKLLPFPAFQSPRLQWLV